MYHDKELFSNVSQIVRVPVENHPADLRSDNGFFRKLLIFLKNLLQSNEEELARSGNIRNRRRCAQRNRRVRSKAYESAD